MFLVRSAGLPSFGYIWNIFQICCKAVHCGPLVLLWVLQRVPNHSFTCAPLRSVCSAGGSEEMHLENASCVMGLPPNRTEACLLLAVKVADSLSSGFLSGGTSPLHLQPPHRSLGYLVALGTQGTSTSMLKTSVSAFGMSKKFQCPWSRSPVFSVKIHRAVAG